MKQSPTKVLFLPACPEVIVAFATVFRLVLEEPDEEVKEPTVAPQPKPVTRNVTYPMLGALSLRVCEKPSQEYK